MHDVNSIRSHKKQGKKKSAKFDKVALVEVLGLGVPQDRHLMKLNKISKKALFFGATTAIGLKEKKGQKLGFFRCGLCDFESDSRQKFSTHISLHNPEGHLQCQECGMCFASEPSWKKHLFLLHRIKRPQPSDYCQSLYSSASSENLDMTKRDLIT